MATEKCTDGKAHLWHGHHHKAYKSKAPDYVCEKCEAPGEFDVESGSIVAVKAAKPA